MRVCENIDCSVIKTSRKPARFGDGVAECTHCGKPLSAPFVASSNAPARVTTSELRGVPLASLGVCTGSWVAVKAPASTQAAMVGALLFGALGLVILLAGQPIPGAVLVIAAVAAGIALQVRNPAGSVRLYERGFELERGKQQAAIAFASIQSAQLVTIEHKKAGIRTSWSHRLELSGELGQLVLQNDEPGTNAEPESDFYEFARACTAAALRR